MKKINSIKNGFEIIHEEGIFQLEYEDGSRYAKCEYNEFDEIECRDVHQAGILKTITGELFDCHLNNDNEGKNEEVLECDLIMEGGYYVIEGELVECDPNAENNQLECKEMTKEGYFISKPDNILYECKDQYEFLSMDMYEYTSSIEDESTESAIATSNPMEEKFISTPMDPLDSIELEMGVKERDISCHSLDTCTQGEVKNYLTNEGVIPMFVCKTMMDSEKEKNETRWISVHCASGNYVKDLNNYYKCEDEKDSLSGGEGHSPIERPHNEYTITGEVPNKTKTTTLTTLTTLTTESHRITSSMKTLSSTASGTTTPQSTKTLSTSISETTTSETTTFQSTNTSSPKEETNNSSSLVWLWISLSSGGVVSFFIILYVVYRKRRR